MKKINKYLIVLILMLAFLILMSVSSLAAKGSYSISKSSVTLTEGSKTTVSITAKNCGGRFDISSSNTSVAKVSGSPVWPENSTQSFTITAVKPGTAKITIVPTSVSGSDPGYEDDVTGNKTITVTVKAKSSSGSSSNSGSNSNSKSENSSTTSTQKPTFTSVNKKVYAKDTIYLRSSWSTSSSGVTVKKGTEMTLTGTSSKEVNEHVWYRVSYNGATKYVSSSLVTTTKPADTKSDEKEEETKDSSKATSTNLKSLNVTPTGLSPAFSTGTTEYTMTVGSNIDEINVNAIAEDSNASVKVDGNKNLKIGSNKITITVTAGEDTKIYNINVTKDSKKQLQLSELLIDGQPLVPEFDSNIYEYTIEKADTSELNITATPSSESAEVEILGNTDFQVGENIVTILVKSSNGEDVTTYQITVNVAQSDAIATEENNDNKKMYLYIGAGAVIVIIVIIIIRSIVKNKKVDDSEEVNLYNGMYNPRGNDEEDAKNGKPSVNTNALPKLDNEDLPKSLRKSDFESKLEEKQNKMSERSKKIDDFYNTQDDYSKEKRKGKHSK